MKVSTFARWNTASELCMSEEGLSIDTAKTNTVMNAANVQDPTIMASA